MQCRERPRRRDFEDRAASPLAVIIPVEIAAVGCCAIEISIGAQSQGRTPRAEAIRAVGLGAKVMQRRRWLPGADLKESAAPDADVAAKREIRRATFTGRAIEFSAGGLDQTIRSAAVSAVGQRAKAIKQCELARRSYAEECSTDREVFNLTAILTPARRYAVEVAVDALHELSRIGRMWSSLKLHQRSKGLRGQSNRRCDAEYSNDASSLPKLKLSHTCSFWLQAGQNCVRVSIFLHARSLARRRSGLTEPKEKRRRPSWVGKTTGSKCATLFAMPAHLSTMKELAVCGSYRCVG